MPHDPATEFQYYSVPVVGAYPLPPIDVGGKEVVFYVKVVPRPTKEGK